jgi:nitrogen regulatory protein PII
MRLITAIVSAARTGEVGDGKIFITDPQANSSVTTRGLSLGPINRCSRPW